MKACKQLALEMSLKPFRSLEESYVEEVCRRVFTQWQPLIKKAEKVAVMLWAADGSEILEYKGNPDDPFEWCYLIGGATRCTDWDKRIDPNGEGLHTTNYLYMENPPVMTYRALQSIIRTLKRIGQELTQKPVLVGATFDPGPEFARSDFKYNRHREICAGASMGHKSMVCCYSRLHADETAYAAYPQGIPEGTPFGEFFGRQAQRFLTDMGYDYLWLSNGFGFGTETWGITGSLFDGTAFSSARLDTVRRQILDFWKIFRSVCSFRVETRGTNLTAGIDFATDGVDLQAIYTGGYDLLPPPNSPWAAIDGDFGMEIAGYLSRIASLPEGEPYQFRFYVHDPWWMNSPWIDRYERKPHDIYLPLALARVDEEGRMQTPEHLNLLTVDNSLGEMPDICPHEVIPHMEEAFRTLPDSPSPLVWVYPFADYFRLYTDRLTKPFFEDSFLCGAVNEGLPVSTVVASELFGELLSRQPELFRGRILVSPVPTADSCANEALLRFWEEGGQVILYGSLRGADERWMKALELRHEEPLYGRLRVESAAPADRIMARDLPAWIQMSDTRTDGGASETPAAGGGAGVLASLTDGKSTRAAVVISPVNRAGGRVGWTRGSDTSRLPREEPEYPMAAQMRTLLRQMGYVVEFEKREARTATPALMMHRHDGGLWFSGYHPDTTVGLRLKTPLGAPLLLGSEGLFEDGCMAYTMPRAWRAECRVFVEQKEAGVISYREIPPVSYRMRRRVMVTGLKDATVRFLPPAGMETELLANSAYPFMVGERPAVTAEKTVLGEALTVRHVTGSLLISNSEAAGDNAPR